MIMTSSAIVKIFHSTLNLFAIIKLISSQLTHGGNCCFGKICSDAQLINLFEDNSSPGAVKNCKSRNTEEFKAKVLVKTGNIEKAENYFDTLYPHTYGEKFWERIKKTLQSKPKYIALINNFADAELIVEKFKEFGLFDVGEFYSKFVEAQQSEHNLSQHYIEPEKVSNIQNIAENNEDFLSASKSRLIKCGNLSIKQLGDYFDYVPSTKIKASEDWVEEDDSFINVNQNLDNLNVEIVKENFPIQWPKNLRIYASVRGEDIVFPHPEQSPKLQVMTHYLMNGASIMPVIALDLRRRDKVLDLCSGPGGKALTCLQTSMPSLLVCNDVSKSRLNRVKRVLQSFVPAEMSNVWDSVDFTQNEGCLTTDFEEYDKVLVDTPCLNDRISMQENDNNIFKNTRVKERLNLPQLQSDLIVSALQFTKPGGYVVYSTCTLSPLQNDGAVHLALNKVWSKTNMDVAVVDFSTTMKNLRFMYKTGHTLGLKYGQIIIPMSVDNYGPMYVCKLLKKR